jgi:hypothetical protein
VIGEGVNDNLTVERKIVEDEGNEEEDVYGSDEDVNNRSLVENEKNQKNEKDVEKNKKKEDGKKVPAHNLPYPKAKSKKDLEKHFKRFLDIFKKLEINIPFAEALDQMPTYAKFMKEILSKKHRYNNDEIIQLDANCSAIIQRRLPKKKKKSRESYFTGGNRYRQCR